MAILLKKQRLQRKGEQNTTPFLFGGHVRSMTVRLKKREEKIGG